MSKKAHEHFCYRCYGHKTNGMASGWWRCVAKKCVKLNNALCAAHRQQSIEAVNQVAPDGPEEAR
jgi:hypothetical protein